MGQNASSSTRAVVNTYLSIACSVVAAIFVGKFTHGGKLNMEIVLKASLAGGVVMGAPSSIIIMPYGAMLAGFLTGCATSFSYVYLPPLLHKFKIHDTCGILFLYGFPGIIGTITSAIVADRADTNFGGNTAAIFPSTGGRYG